MKKTTLFRGWWSKRDKHPAQPTGQVPAPPAAAKEVTEQELEEVQGGRAPVRVRIDSPDD